MSSNSISNDSCSISSSSESSPSKVLKPCCVCKETRKARDECMIKYQDGESMCKDLIIAHLACMRSYGFEIV